MPIRRSDPSVNATTDGVVRPPSSLAITFGFPLLVIIFNLEGAWDVLKIPMDRNTASMAEVQQALKVQMSNAQLAGLAAGLVMFQVILLTLMGANNGGREISAERILYEKERMTGLRPWAYAFSKIVFVSLVAIFQGVWMCVFVKLICSFPGPWAEQLAILAASCVSMSVVCLGFSAMLTSPEKSSLLSIYLVGFQLPLSGVVLALPAALTSRIHPPGVPKGAFISLLRRSSFRSSRFMRSPRSHGGLRIAVP